MADDKKYYYLKLKDNFFDSDTMIILETMPDGYLYSNILLKLYLRSLKFKGKLMFSEKIPYNSNMLAQVTRHDVDVMEKALQAFKELDLIEIMDSGAIYMLDIQNFIGKSSTEADRKRNYRQQIDVEKSLNDGQVSGQTLGQMSAISPDKSTPEKEIEIEIKREKKTKKSASTFCDELFEQLWKLYPNKKGKLAVSKKSKEAIFKIGLEKMVRAIENYKRDLEVNSWRQPMNGSTFFNGRYADYFSQEQTEVPETVSLYPDL